MSLITNKFEHAYQNAIKTIGVGKRGSKPMDRELVAALSEEIRTDSVPEAALGAILGALMMKGLTSEERLLTSVLPENIFDDPRVMIGFLSPERLPKDLEIIYARLIKGETLDRGDARTLGGFLFSPAGGDGLRGLAASIMRVRYESREEYIGLLESARETFRADFKKVRTGGKTVIQLAEPFDGVDQSSLITPSIAEFLLEKGYCPVALVGRNSGPKKGVTLFDIAGLLPTGFLRSVDQLAEAPTPFGWHLHQADLSSVLDRWVDIRRTIIKRPFLATIERFVNPVQADIHVASAFHAPYGEKMLNLCEDAGFPAAVIVRNGMEGSIGLPLLRPAKLLCTVRQSDGRYRRAELEYDSQSALRHGLTTEEKLRSADAVHNKELVLLYRTDGHTSNRHFDMRLEATKAGLNLALDWIKTNRS